MKLLTNIKTKVWSCVCVALLAYIIATIATSISNNRISEELTHIEEAHFPLALKGEKVLTLFKEQTKYYENALLTGEEDELVKANQLNDEISTLLNELVHISSGFHKEFYPGILSLRDNYEDYFNMASEQYLASLRAPDPFSYTKEMRRISKIRDKLREDFQNKANLLTKTVSHEINVLKKAATNNTTLLQILFVAVLLIISIVINLMANRQLIMPLDRLKGMIESFARGKSIEKPEICSENDEICALALSFWDMTEKLKEISISKRYVDNIINNISDSLIVLSPSLTIQRVNKSTLHLLEAEENNLIGQPIQQIFRPEEDASTPQTLFDELILGKSITNLEMTLQTSLGKYLPILFSGTPLYQPDGSSIQAIVCLVRDISQLKEDAVKREISINYDLLTNLPNRNLLLDRLQHSLFEAKRYKHQVALLLLEIDHFASITKKFGQEAGNHILREMANRLCLSVRETDTVARTKASEFAILLNRIDGAEDAQIVAAKIIKQISHPFSITGTDAIEVSLGIALLPEEEVDRKTLLNNADCALAEAKSQGGNRYLFFTSK